MMNNAGTVLEIIWFVMGGLLLFIGVDVLIASGIGESWYYLLFSLLAFIMYYRRRRIRISSR
jgi:hypothetical protein